MSALHHSTAHLHFTLYIFLHFLHFFLHFLHFYFFTFHLLPFYLFSFLPFYRFTVSPFYFLPFYLSTFLPFYLFTFLPFYLFTFLLFTFYLDRRLKDKWRWQNRERSIEGSGRDKQGIGGRIKSTGVVEEGDEEHGAREATIGEKGSCFQLSSEADGSIREGKLQKTVRMLEEKMKDMNNRICVLEGNSEGEEKEVSSSDEGYEKDWRWDKGQ